MLQPSFKSVIEDSYRNKYFIYYSGTSVCCKEVSRDGVPRDTIIASQVSDNFLATIDLQDRIYVACQSKEKGVYIFQYANGGWKVDQILNVQGSGSLILLSLFGINGALHIIYAKQMAVANFYNIYHLFKPATQGAYYVSTNWKKYNVCEMYAEDPNSSYSAIMSKEGIIHLVCEWFDGSNYLINYFSYESPDNPWNKKTVTSLFKKDIALSLLYEESTIHLLCYTYEEEASEIFYFIKREGSAKDFEFCCLDKINTEDRVSPYFHIESSVIYASWIKNNSFFQYSLGKDQKNWDKKISTIIPEGDALKLIEYIRNRKGRHWVIKNTYFTIDYKYNINLPYFKEASPNEAGSKAQGDVNVSVRNVDGDLVKYIPYLMEEVSVLSQMIKVLGEKLDKLESAKTVISEYKPSDKVASEVEPHKETKDTIRLKRSNFKDQFLKTNRLLTRPDAAAVYMGSGSIPDPDELSKRDKFEIVENLPSDSPALQVRPKNVEPSTDTAASKLDADSIAAKDSNIFKKIGDFFK